MLNPIRSNSTCNQPWKLEFDPMLQQYYYVNLEDNTISFDSPNEVMNHKKSNKKQLFLSFKKGNKGDCFASKRRSSSSSSKGNTEKPRSKSIYRRLSDTLSLKSSKSNESDEIMLIPNNSPRTSIATIDSNSAIDSDTLIDTAHIDDEYLLNNNRINNFKNFSGTSQVNLHFGYISDINDSESISSGESILNGNEEEDEIEDDEDEVKVFNQKYIYNPNYDGAFFDYEDDECNDNEYIDIEKENERRELRLQILKELY